MNAADTKQRERDVDACVRHARWQWQFVGQGHPYRPLDNGSFAVSEDFFTLVRINWKRLHD